jgi:hypothetical protein
MSHFGVIFFLNSPYDTKRERTYQFLNFNEIFDMSLGFHSWNNNFHMILTLKLLTLYDKGSHRQFLDMMVSLPREEKRYHCKITTQYNFPRSSKKDRHKISTHSLIFQTLFSVTTINMEINSSGSCFQTH